MTEQSVNTEQEKMWKEIAIYLGIHLKVVKENTENFGWNS
jgi:hypothetical protein